MKEVHLIQRTLKDAQHTRGDADVPDGIMNSTPYARSQTLWRISKLED